MVKEQDFNSKQIKPLKERLRELNTIMFAVVIVMLIGFLTLLFALMGLVNTYQHDNDKSYQEYRNELMLNNYKIDQLIDNSKK